MRVGLISCNGRARDAIGNHLADKFQFFQDHGADVRVFVQDGSRLHATLAGHAEILERVLTTGDVWDFLAGADLVIVDFAQDYALLQYLPLLAGGRPRLLVEYHGITPPHLWTGPQKAALEQGLARRNLLWCADYALVHSQFTHRDLVKATGFPDDRIFQLDFPLHERFHPALPKWSLRANLGLSTEHILLYVGRLATNKCIPTLIEAVALLRDLEPAVHAVVIGDNTDVYQEEERRCQELAGSLGVAARVHFLGAIDDDRLADSYRAADLLVIPSTHEGFCVPVMEAMACGLPVITARTSALPETVGGVGLSFTQADASDLAAQVRRVLTPDHFNKEPALGAPRRVAVVSFRFGADIVGGAETSLRKIAHALAHAGYQVEVFTTCTRAESDWTNELPGGTTHEDGLVIHRFPIDAHDRNLHLESVRKLIQADGHISPAQEQAYLENSIHSSALMASLAGRIDDVDAVLVGPYLFGLTWDVARAFPNKTLLLGCFHEEPLARLRTWPVVYGRVGGILYHSPEERELAQTVLGINHPNATEIGTYLESAQPSPSRGTSSDVADKPYVVYCGRYSRQKELPRLLEFAAHYEKEHPGRIQFLFMGQGEVEIPDKPWLRDVGRVDEATKRALLAGAAALVQLSKQESLSLVVLEAWAVGTPVIVARDCAVLAGQVRRAGGGQAIDDYSEFADTLDDLAAKGASWRELGQRGRAYVDKHYASESEFATRIEEAIGNLRVPLGVQMRTRGLARAAQSTMARWRDRFGCMVETILDRGPRPYRTELTILPLRDKTTVKLGARTALVSLRIGNLGSHAVCADGAARHVLFSVVGSGRPHKTELPGLLPPGQTRTMAALVGVPVQTGDYPMRFWINREGGNSAAVARVHGVLSVSSAAVGGCAAPFLETIQEALVEAERHRCLPDDYLDVTRGRFARWKLWLKRKLLGNFKRGYVDVLSRQQTEVNRQVLTALQQLTECCATLDHALQGLQQRMDRLEENVELEAKVETPG